MKLRIRDILDGNRSCAPIRICILRNSEEEYTDLFESLEAHVKLDRGHYYSHVEARLYTYTRTQAYAI